MEFTIEPCNLSFVGCLLHTLYVSKIYNKHKHMYVHMCTYFSFLESQLLSIGQHVTGPAPLQSPQTAIPSGDSRKV